MSFALTPHLHAPGNNGVLRVWARDALHAPIGFFFVCDGILFLCVKLFIFNFNVII